MFFSLCNCQYANVNYTFCMGTSCTVFALCYFHFVNVGVILCFLSDFELWKEETERESRSSFVKSRAACKTSNGSRRVFYCNRNGIYKSKGCGKRQLKIQGSCKTGGSCPAAIVVDENNGQLHCRYYPTHYGHEVKVAFQRISAGDKQEIAGKFYICMP